MKHAILTATRFGMSLALGAATAAAAAEGSWTQGPIPIRFRLDRPGYVTLVIDDANGVRVRNLLAEEKFEAGEHTVFWDGADGSEVHLHKRQGELVAPGEYRVRGLVRDELKLIYEFAVYNPGTPPWGARDPVTGLYYGRWLSDHNSASGALFLPDGSPAGKQPQLMFCAGGAEWGDGFMWTDLDGRKLHGQRWAGGVFAGAEWLAADAGGQGPAGVYAYSVKGMGKTKEGQKPDFRFKTMAFLADSKAQEGQPPFAEIQVLGKDCALTENKPAIPGERIVGGIAVWNGLIVVSAPCVGQLVVLDVRGADAAAAKPKRGGTPAPFGQELTRFELTAPGGVAFDKAGNLVAISGRQVVVLPAAGPALAAGRPLPTPRPLIAEGLAAPFCVALDRSGKLYVSDRGGSLPPPGTRAGEVVDGKVVSWPADGSHQVKVFGPDGKFSRAIGKPGGARLGAYDEQRMFNPAQVAVTDAGEVWVAETQFTPRRISRWKADGTFIRAYYGPPGYGGGGTVTPDGKTVLYCHGNPWEAQATLEFDIDWQAGSSRVARLAHWIDVPGGGVLRTPGNGGPMERFVHEGRRYAHNGSQEQVTWWLERDGRWIPVAAMTRPKEWKEALGSEPFQGKIPAAVNLEARYDDGPPFAWADLNGDGVPQPDEFKWYAGQAGARGRPNYKIGNFCGFDGFRVFTTFGRIYQPIGFTEQGAPIFDPNAFTNYAPLVAGNPGDPMYGGSVLPTPDGGYVQLGSPLCLWRDGQRVWTYPNEWFGVHASHSAPPPRWGGDINGGIGACGPLFSARGGEAGKMWVLNSNMGAVHIGTVDGLYVATVMRDCRKAGPWPATIKRGDNVIEYTNGQESFGVSLNPLDDGRIVMSVGGTMIGLCRLEGLETVKRLPDQKLVLTEAQIKAAQDWQAKLAAAKAPARGTLNVLMHPASRRPGENHEQAWKDADWAPIEVEERGQNEIVRVKAALAVFGDKLHAVWVAPFDEKPLDNTVESLPMVFKTGAGLDLMLRSGEGAEQRVLITARKTKGAKGIEPVAVRYRPHSPTGGNKTKFSSPWREIEFDDVADVSADVALAETYLKAKPFDYRAFEVSIPLATLGLKPQPGMTIKGDVGLLRGSAGSTAARVYWHNKATGLTADVPGEAMLQPELWGTLRFTTAAAADSAPPPAPAARSEGARKRGKRPAGP
mgnify:CR=1 FL=1